jgi:hypothetical protein
MDMYSGRLTASGAYVAVGSPDELIAAARSHEVIEVTTPTGNVARAHVVGVGRRFQTQPGAPWCAYGYLEDADGAA